MDLFDFIKCLLEKKYLTDEELEKWKYKDYIYIINRYISMNIENLFLINYLNMLNITDGRLHFDFLYKMLPKQNGFIKYTKFKNKNIKNEEVISLLSSVYRVSKKDIVSYFDLLNDKQVKEIIAKYKKN